MLRMLSMMTADGTTGDDIYIAAGYIISSIYAAVYKINTPLSKLATHQYICMQHIHTATSS